MELETAVKASVADRHAVNPMDHDWVTCPGDLAPGDVDAALLVVTAGLALAADGGADGNENICGLLFRDVANYPTRIKISPSSLGVG